MRIRFDRGPAGPAQEFANPTTVVTVRDADDVLPALAEIEQHRANGKWVAGYMSYEAGYALEPVLTDLMPEKRTMPLLSFGIFDAPFMADRLPDPGGRVYDIEPVWTQDHYQAAFDQVRDWIGAGDIYQANLTFPMRAKIKGDARAVYAALVARQPVGHGAMVLQRNGATILSRSPELFFRVDTSGKIETRPMKGTMPRDDDPTRDAANRDFLSSDEKNRAENLMIVDLLRNDISRVCEVGSVKVPELFSVESYNTVHQMVSLIQGQLKPNVGLADMMKALFPCGSITGAPKVRSMEVIRALEPAPRDIYCGSIGWMAPDGSAEFNVAIRTMIVEGDDVRFNVGGGVVWDSTAPSEYEEALWKARFAQISQVT